MTYQISRPGPELAKTVERAATQQISVLCAVPPAFERRSLPMRAFVEDAMLKTSALALASAADRSTQQLFQLDELAYIDIHDAAHGGFLARAERFQS
jgi:molybdopterin-guanine dinucleotide biosynthesis protein A